MYGDEEISFVSISCRLAIKKLKACHNGQKFARTQLDVFRHHQEMYFFKRVYGVQECNLFWEFLRSVSLNLTISCPSYRKPAPLSRPCATKRS